MQQSVIGFLYASFLRQVKATQWGHRRQRNIFHTRYEAIRIATATLNGKDFSGQTHTHARAHAGTQRYGFLVPEKHAHDETKSNSYFHFHVCSDFVVCAICVCLCVWTVEWNSIPIRMCSLCIRHRLIIIIHYLFVDTHIQRVLTNGAKVIRAYSTNISKSAQSPLRTLAPLPLQRSLLHRKKRSY